MALHRDPVTAEVVALFGRIVTRYNDEFDGAADRHELTRLQAKALVFVEEPRLMRDLARHLRVMPSSATGIVDRLAARGLVDRRSVEADRRASMIVATEDGRMITKDFKDSLEFAAKPLAGFNASERCQLRDLLRRMSGDVEELSRNRQSSDGSGEQSGPN